MRMVMNDRAVGVSYISFLLRDRPQKRLVADSKVGTRHGRHERQSKGRMYERTDAGASVPGSNQDLPRQALVDGAGIEPAGDPSVGARPCLLLVADIKKAALRAAPIRGFWLRAVSAASLLHHTWSHAIAALDRRLADASRDECGRGDAEVHQAGRTLLHRSHSFHSSDRKRRSRKLKKPRKPRGVHTAGQQSHMS